MSKYQVLVRTQPKIQEKLQVQRVPIQLYNIIIVGPAQLGPLAV